MGSLIDNGKPNPQKLIILNNKKYSKNKTIQIKRYLESNHICYFLNHNNSDQFELVE